MKKRILVAVVSVVLAAVILLLLPVVFPQGHTPTDPNFTGQFTKPTKPTNTAESSPVRLYSCNETWLAALEILAEEYTRQTGVEVLLLRPQTDDCQESLDRLMESEDQPTVFCIHSQNDLNQWQDRLLDLRDTTLQQALCAESFGLYLQEKLLAVPMDLEAFGLLVNLELLGTKGALSRKDITDSHALTMACQILKDNAFKAFPANKLDLVNALCLLQGSDADRLRSFLDLYAGNGSTSGTAQTQFQNGECVFYLGKTSEYARLTAQEDQALQVRNLDILPTYAAGGMQYLFSTAWCVNGDIPQAEIEATLAFLTWLVSAGEDGAAPIDALKILTPFADAQGYENQLEKKVLGYMKTESMQLQWQPTSGNYTNLMVALQTYLDKRSDANWAVLQTMLAQIGK